MFSAAILATVLGYTWIVAPIAPRWMATAAGAVVIALSVTHAIRTRDWGLAPAAFAAAVARAAAFTLIAGAGVALAGWRLHSWHARPDLWQDALVLVPWGLGQQFALQTTLLRDAERLTPRAAVLVAAGAFAALHLPNPFLTAATFAAALVWCWIYSRHPNVLPLALSHAALTLMVLCAFDDAVTGRLRVARPISVGERLVLCRRSANAFALRIDSRLAAGVHRRREAVGPRVVPVVRCARVRVGDRLELRVVLIGRDSAGS